MKVVLALGLALAMGAAAWSAPATWPGGRQAAVVLTYDDGLKSQLDVAIPALDAHQFKATFFLTGRIDRHDVPRWRAAAAEGHELGNHTVFHPCPRGSYPMPAQYNSESYTVETMIAEISAMNTLLTAIDGKLEHPFAAPCGETTAGGASYLTALRASGLAKYGRGVVGSPRFDALNVKSRFFGEHEGIAEMVTEVEYARLNGTLLVLGFHGVGGDYQAASADTHRRLLDYLRARDGSIWVAPFGEVMDYAVKHRMLR